MKRFLVGVILGVLIGAWISTPAQVEEPLTIRVPPIASDSTWTQAQRSDLINQWSSIVTQLNMVNRSFAGRMRQID